MNLFPTCTGKGEAFSTRAKYVNVAVEWQFKLAVHSALKLQGIVGGFDAPCLFPEANPADDGCPPKPSTR